ncbi:MAG: hypothetical protein MUP74_05280, partial [Desulfobacterales bacterium]|nr:hypothetical protein [Desulfobacterales bacterium]
MDAAYRTWRGEQWGRRCLANLKKHDFDAHFFSTVDEAAAAIWDRVSHFTTILHRRPELTDISVILIN